MEGWGIPEIGTSRYKGPKVGMSFGYICGEIRSLERKGEIAKNGPGRRQADLPERGRPYK